MEHKIEILHIQIQTTYKYLLFYDGISHIRLQDVDIGTELLDYVLFLRVIRTISTNYYLDVATCFNITNGATNDYQIHLRSYGQVVTSGSVKIATNTR